MIAVGGVIPPQDYPALYQAGASAVFGPGTVIGEAAAELVRTLAHRLDIAWMSRPPRCPEVRASGRNAVGRLS